MFKEYTQNQLLLLPPDISTLIPEEHLARVINEVVGTLDISAITSGYSALGQNAYHPRMLLKVLFYAYATGIRSSRKIAQKLGEDVVYMWLAGMQKPDFRTIALFRSTRISSLKKLFVEIVSLCVEMGITKLGRIFIDGTKIEANASGNKMLYLKSLERREKNIERKIQEIVDAAQKQDELEDKKYLGKNGKSVPAALRKQENRLNKLKEAAERVKEQKELLKQRSNCSRTDKDANLMKMKRDYIYPAYNVQFSTNSQVIIEYEAVNKCNDTAQLKPQVKQMIYDYGLKPEEVVTDAGYGVEKNYAYLAKEKIDGIIPYPALKKERSRAYQNNPCSRDKFRFDEKAKQMRCPQGYLMKLTQVKKDNRTGRYIKIFKGIRCAKCRLQALCTAAAYREYDYQPFWEKTKKKLKAHLSLDWVKEIYNQRKMEVEAVIGNIKHNLKFNKFLLRGLKKVNIEADLISIAHN
ncbi:MAG TPA: IS1182 family transposase, partial [Candidatus Omnitrophica bacterium]|nr:IS1182 family transposase [Candidatus Omnitrophota bacterium]